MDDDPGGALRSDGVGERVLFAQSRRFVEQHRVTDLVAQVVAGVDRRGDELSAPVAADRECGGFGGVRHALLST